MVFVTRAAILLYFQHSTQVLLSFSHPTKKTIKRGQEKEFDRRPGSFQLTDADERR